MRRKLGPVDGASLVVANTIGVGIFTTPPLVACLVPSSGARLGLWFAGGLLAWIGATAYAELASRRPRAGGEYVYIREAYGPILGFLTGWTSLVAGFSGAIAAAALAASGLLRNLFSIGGNQSFSETSMALLIVVAAAALHTIGINAGSRVQNGLTVLKIGCLLLIAGIGLSAPVPHNSMSAGSGSVTSGWMTALIPIMFSYSGWNAAAYLAEEIRDPRRNLPRALLLGTAAVAALYLIVNFAFSQAIPASALCKVDNAAVEVTRRTWGPTVELLISIVTAIILLSSISAMTMAGPRVYFAMARDRVFPRAAARLHSHFGTPAVAIAAQTAWASALILTGTFEELLAYTGFAVVTFGALAVSCVFVMRRRGEDAPFRMWGYPILPAIFILTMCVVLTLVIISSPIRTAAGIAVIAAGVPIYFVSRPRGARAEEPNLT